LSVILAAALSISQSLTTPVYCHQSNKIDKHFATYRSSSRQQRI